MNRYDLLIELEKNHIDPQCYSIYGVTEPPEEEQYVFIKENKRLEIFYLERGNRNEEQWFIDEDEACRYFLEWIVRVPGNRIKP
ncbi:MAG: hypothetical protein JW712_01790 [Dehalococcoidales bacterium]|nr:hypothetical protein [Dehalococcoidales bacterium]